jgi:tetratricopeptide (TPR) repeat protein
MARIPREEGRQLSRKALDRALALNPNLAEAHGQMWRIKKFVDLDWAGADDSIQRAIALDPANPEYLGEASFSAAAFGRWEDALALITRAVELDPLNAGNQTSFGEMKYFENHLAEAEEDVKKSLELDPDFWGVPTLLTKIYIAQGRPHDALREIEQVRPVSFHTYLYAITYAALGEKKRSDAALKELISKYSRRGAFQVAEVYAYRNQRDEAFEWLDRSYVQHEGSVAFTNLEPLLKNLHADPRYAVFLKKIHLPVLP